MNKHIIIDGVDVSECDCYDNTYCLWSKKYHEIRITPKCEIVKDCYFKQLKRLKAENDGLKSQLDFEVQKRETVEAENEKLKTKIFDEGLRRKTCKYYKQVCSENTQLIAYRNALEEIQNVLFPKNKLLITDSKGLLKTQEILKEVLKDV